MPFNYFAIRDHLKINGEPFRARFLYTPKELNNITNTELFNSEVTEIPRITLEGRYSTNQVTLVKTLTFAPVVVQSEESASFNTIIVTAGPSIVAKYQFQTYIQIRKNTPALIVLGNINMDFE